MGLIIESRSKQNEFPGLASLVFGGGLGYITGMTAGVYKIGQRNGLDGSLAVTILSSIIGTAVGVQASVTTENIIPMLIIPQTCATVGYHLSR